jgi:SPP1 gp7 family putative phage head morphogenesis protein
MKYTNKQITNLLNGIESGQINEYNLPEDLYFAIVDYLKEGVFKGYGSNLNNVLQQDKELLTQLVENVHIFSGAKTYQQVKEINSLLVDEDGNLVSSSEFNKLGREKFDLWNDTWGETEYNTAVGQSQMASKWADIERNKDVLPNLEYSAVMDENTSDICEPLNGIIAPVDDPIWDTISPLNHFNCRCVLLQVETEPTEDNEDSVQQVEDNMQDLFKHNPYKTGSVFPKSHPYFDVPKEDKAYAKRNFDLPIPNYETTPNKFTKAKTINEAEQYLKDNNIAKDVSFTGANLDTLNEVNKTLTELSNEFKIRPLDKLNNTINKKSTNAHANGEILEFNKEYISKPRKEYKLDPTERQGLKDSLDFFLKTKKEKPELFSGLTTASKKNRKALANLEEGVKYQRWGASGGDIVRTTTHEFAHVLERQYLNNDLGIKASKVNSKHKLNIPNNIAQEILDDFDKLYTKIITSNDKYLISEYSMANRSEMFAETFTMYKYENEKLPKYITDFFTKTLNKFKKYGDINL